MMFLFYGRIAGTFVDYTKYQILIKLNITSEQYASILNQSKW
jgi:hypothetical protein